MMQQVEDLLICTAIIGCIIAAAAVVWEMIGSYKTRH